MHGLVEARARRPPAPRLGDRAGHRGRRGEAHRGVLRRPGGVGAVAAAGLPAGPGHRRGGGGEPAGHRRGAGRPRDHRVGRDQRGGEAQLAGDHRRRRRRTSTSTAWPEPFGAVVAGNEPLPEAERRAKAAAHLPDDPRAGLHRPGPGRATTPTATRCWSSSPARSSRRWPSWARPARTTSCAPRSSRWWWTCPRRRRSRRSSARLRELHAAYREDYARLLRAARRPGLAADARRRPGHRARARRRDVLLRRATSRPPGWRASSTSTRST